MCHQHHTHFSQLPTYEAITFLNKEPSDSASKQHQALSFANSAQMIMVGIIRANSQKPFVSFVCLVWRTCEGLN